MATGRYNGGDLAGTRIVVRATGPEDFASVNETKLSTGVDFRDGQFVSPASSSDDQHYTSPEGESWTLVESPLGPGKTGGVYLRAKSKRIERSEDGLEWTAVTDELPGNVQGFAFGEVEL